MKHHERIEDYLQHIAEAIDRITGYVQGINDAEALERDHKTQAAVVCYIEEPRALYTVDRGDFERIGTLSSILGLGM